MTASPRPDTDPWAYQAGITLFFALAVFWSLGIPSKPYFDEIHYVPAARAMLAGHMANPEHPMLGKEAIALAIRLLGDTPLAWRLPSALAGCVGLFAFGRALWLASGRRVAALAGMVLLATDFSWFVQSRIAMLDMVMAGLTMLALWLAAGAVRSASPVGQRLRLAGCGLAFALALSAKWSAAPVFALVAGGLMAAQMSGRALRGLRLGEVVAWLAIMPPLAYWLTFAPAFFYAQNGIAAWNIIGWHRFMLDLQASVVKLHPYQSHWPQWIINQRPIWYLYEHVDGAQRGILLLGNPFTMLAGLMALGWALMRRAFLPLALAALYLATLALWIFGHKPVQFYYHYLLSAAFLMAMLGLAVDAMWAARGMWRKEALGVLLIALALFGWFWPILSGAPLHKGVASYQDWMWLSSWR